MVAGESRLAARTAVMFYIEGWYNRRRPSRQTGDVLPVRADAIHQTSGQDPLATSRAS